MNKKVFYVEGMHCPSCELYIESQFKNKKGIKSVKSSNEKQTLTFNASDTVNTEELIESINEEIEPHGYKIGNSLEVKENTLKDLPLAFSIAGVFLILFWGIQKLTLGSSLISSEVTYPMIFFIGIIASVSSCMAVVGSLVLSMSSIFAKEKEGIKPLIFFHLSRLVGFFLLGGVLGVIGSLIILSSTVELIIGFVLFIVMVILGLNLLDIHPVFRRFELTIPKSFSNKIVETSTVKSIFTPLILGAGTFFLPCGFTQSMQLNSVVSGNFLDGALTMLVFALGTLPMLALITFGSNKISQSKNSPLFFKTAGFVVIFFAIYNLIGVLVANGVISPIF